MNKIDPYVIETLIEEHLDQKEIDSFYSDETTDPDIFYLKYIQGIAREVNGSLVPSGDDWVYFLGQVFPLKKRDKILIGLFGLGKDSAELDDLFGEKASGWARELEDSTVTDILASVVTWWVLDDFSRMGYLEAWAARGENVWKKRLAASTTTIINETCSDLVNESLGVLRHIMESTDIEILEAISRALRKISDKNAVVRFLAWWKPRIPEQSLEILLSDMDETILENIKNI